MEEDLLSLFRRNEEYTQGRVKGEDLLNDIDKLLEKRGSNMNIQTIDQSMSQSNPEYGYQRIYKLLTRILEGKSAFGVYKLPSVGTIWSNLVKGCMFHNINIETLTDVNGGIYYSSFTLNNTVFVLIHLPVDFTGDKKHKPIAFDIRYNDIKYRYVLCPEMVGNNWTQREAYEHLFMVADLLVPRVASINPSFGPDESSLDLSAYVQAVAPFVMVAAAAEEFGIYPEDIKDMYTGISVISTSWEIHMKIFEDLHMSLKDFMNHTIECLTQMAGTNGIKSLLDESCILAIR